MCLNVYHYKDREVSCRVTLTSHFDGTIQPVPTNMTLEMLVEMHIEILGAPSPRLFSREPFEKRPVLTIEDFVLHSDDPFESHLLGSSTI